MDHDEKNVAAKLLEESIQAKSRLRMDRPLIVSLSILVAVFTACHHHLDAQYDFGVFYYAGHMVLDGSRHLLYNLDAQRVFQLRFHRPPETLFRNPPAALLLILPLVKLPILAAYVVWTILEVGLLFICLRRLEIETSIHYGNWPILLALIYVPVMACLLHGQFSILMLAAFVFAYSLWKKDWRFSGGLVLAIVTLKFQLIIGFIAILLLKRKWRELAGFACGSSVLLALSIFITGIPALLAYPHFVLHSDSPISELYLYANWQGFLSLFGQNYPWLVTLLSLVTVLWAAWVWKDDLDRGFCAAILASMLVSYHFTPQDLTLSVLPFYLCVNAGVLPRSRIFVCGLVCLLIPGIMIAIDIPLALLLIPIVATLWWVGYKKMPKAESAGGAPIVIQTLN